MAEIQRQQTSFDLNKPNNKNVKLDIKSPVFQPRPGWGGKLKKWLSRHFESKILPIIACFVLGLGIYLTFFK